MVVRIMQSKGFIFFFPEVEEALDDVFSVFFLSKT